MSDLSPPKWSTRILRTLIRGTYLEEIEGDLEEVFQDDLEIHGLRTANRHYNLGVFQAVRPNLIKRIKWLYQLRTSNSMTRTFRIALRSLLKFKGHSAINLIGLSVGLAIAGFVLKYALDQFTYDDFHVNKDRIFKVVTASRGGGMESNAWPLGNHLRTNYPEVEGVVYARRAPVGFKVYHNLQRFDHDVHFASEDFFRLFSFHLKQGQVASALNAPYTVVITEELAIKYFEGDALGKVLTFQDSIDFTVTGVVGNIPNNSHIQFDALISFSTLIKMGSFSYTEGWGNFNARNYLMLKEGVSAEAFQSKVSGIYEEEVGDWLKEMGVEFTVGLVPLSQVFLNSDYWNGFGPNGSKRELQTLLVIAIFLLLLACVNYINLSTARAAYRAKEIGIKKVVGSSRKYIIGQFMAESTLLTVLAAISGLGIIMAILPLFNQLMDKQYVVADFLTFSYLFTIIVLVMSVSFISGFYPALVMSGFKPLQALSGKGLNSKSSAQLRKGLIIFQFFVSSGLVLSTLLVISQLNFMKRQNLGFDKDQVLIIDATDVAQTSAKQVLENEIRSFSTVQSVSQTNALPGRPGWQGQWAYPDEVTDQPVDTEYMAIDETYLPTLGLQLLAGSNFDLTKPSELKDGLIINESCVKAMGWTNPEDAIGRRIVSPSERPAGLVIGVVKDYHGLGLQERIWPKAMDFAAHEYGRYYAVRFNPGQIDLLLDQLEKSWDQVFSGYPLKYKFLDQDFARQYEEENRLAQLLSIFAVIVIIVSIIGLLGLISFITLSKTKEVGIRKVLGANTSHIIYVLSRQFIFLVLFGNLLSMPLIWLYGNDWLNNFAYRTDLNPLLFLLAAFVTALIAFAAVGLHTWRTARMNPVISLRYE